MLKWQGTGRFWRLAGDQLGQKGADLIFRDAFIDVRLFE